MYLIHGSLQGCGLLQRWAGPTLKVMIIKNFSPPVPLRLGGIFCFSGWRTSFSIYLLFL